MSNLIKNELVKIIKKKAIYIIFIVILLFMILEFVIDNVLVKFEFNYDEEISFYQEQLKGLNPNDSNARAEYNSLEANIEVIKLMKKYGEDSWQAYVIRNYGYDLILNMKLSDENDNKYKEEYEKMIERLESNDWKQYAIDELQKVDEEINILETQGEGNSQSIEYLKNHKQVLEWRLNKDISYANTNLNKILTDWEEEKNSLYNLNEKAKSEIKYSDKYEIQQITEAINLEEYAIENVTNKNVEINFAGNIHILGSNLDVQFANICENYQLFIIVLITIIAGSIMSEEFNKGTIKLLLVRPYKRVKIIMAKFIASFVILIGAIVIISLMQFIIGGITFGFENYSYEIIVYNFNANEIEVFSLIRFMILITCSKMPIFILIMTLSFMLGVIFTSTPIAIAIPYVGMVISSIINDIAYTYEKAKFLKYFVTTNWDLSVFLLGKIPEFEPISLAFSIAICIIYFAIMLIITLTIFNKKDIKNI